MRDVETELLPMYAVSEADAKLFIEWMRTQRASTDFDMSVIGYPRACMTRVTQSEKTIAMVPFHAVFMMESLAHDSGLSDSQLVLALSSVNDKIQQAMQDSGMAETFFETDSERFVYLCMRHGWEIALHDPAKNKWLLKNEPI